ncbi:MAG: ATP-binding protein [Firmicutes bacterium]|nr:ATP-binding protein [Bacillota bacterium]
MTNARSIRREKEQTQPQAKHLLIPSSNKSLSERGEVLGNAVIATAILDRLPHHSHAVDIRGQSYRLRERRCAGLLWTAQPSRG